MEYLGIGFAALVVAGLLFGAVYFGARAFSRSQAALSDSPPPAILDNIASNNNAWIIVQRGGKVRNLNDRARQLFGLNGEVPDLNRLARMVQPQDAFIELFAAEGQANLSVGNRLLDATSVYVSGEPQQFVVTLRESAQLTGLRSDDRSGQTIAALAEVGRALSSSLDLETTLNAVLQTVGRIVQYDVSELNLWESDSQMLRPRARHGDRSSVIALDQRVQSYRTDEGYSGWLARNKAPLIINDIRTYSEVRPKLTNGDFPFRSFIGVPLLFGKNKELVGTLELVSFAPEAFTEADIPLLETVAGQAAVSIRNAQLYSQQETRIAELSGLAQVAQTAATLADPHELYASLVDRIAKLMSVQYCGFLLYNESERSLVSQPPFRGVPEAFRERYRIFAPPDSPAAQLWRDTQYWYTDDMRTDPRIESFGLQELAVSLGMGGSLFVPLIVGGNRLGAVQVANKLDQTLFNDEDARLLRTLAGQAAVLIDNARLVRESEERVHRADVMRQISEITGSARDLEEIYSEVMDRTAKLINADLGVVMLLDESKGELAPQPGSQFGGVFAEAEISRIRSDSPEFKLSATMTRRPFFGWRASRDRRIIGQFRQVIEHYNLESVMTVPLVVQDRSIGEMWWGAHRERRFTRNDLELVATVAAQVASAIERARLASVTDETLRRRVEQLTALTRVGRELNQTLELEHILQLVYDESVRATRADCGSIVLLDLEAATPTARMRLGAHTGEAALNVVEHDVALSGASHLIHDLVAPGALRSVVIDPSLDLAPPGHDDIRSLLVVPVNYQGSTVGIIELHSRTPNAFDRAMLDFSQAVAAQAAIAAGNAQRYEEQLTRGELLRRRADQLAQLLQISRTVRSDKPLAANLEAIAFGVQEAVGYNVILISVLDPATDLLHRTANAGLPMAEFDRLRQRPGRWKQIEPALKPEFRISQSYYVPHDRTPRELRNIDSVVIPKDDTYVPGHWHPDDYLFVPLIGSGGQPTGMMTVDDPRNNLAPDLSTIETLEIFANQAALAIENARLYQSAEIRAAELSHSLGELQKSYHDLDIVSRTLTRKEQELRDLIDQTELRARRLLALHRIASSVAEAREENALLQRAARATVVEMDVDVCILALLHEGTVLQITAQATITDLDIDLNAYLGSHNPLTHIIDIHSPLLARDLHGWVDSRLVESLELRSFGGVPIYVGGEVSGALLVGVQQSHKPLFNTEDIDLLTILSGQLGASLEIVRLFNELQHRLSENTRLFNETRELQEFSSSVFESLQQGLVVLNTDNKILSLNGWMHHHFGWSDSLIGEGLFDFRPLYGELGLANAIVKAVINDQPIDRIVIREPGLDGSMIVSNFSGYPLKREDKVTGVVLVIEDVTARTRLEADVRERATQLQALTEASRIISSALREENVVALVLDQVARVIPYDSATLWLRNEDVLRVASARGFEDDTEQLGLVVQVEDSRLFKEMSESGQPLLVPDVREDVRFPAGIISRTRSWLGVPLMSKGKPLGLLALDKVETNFYSTSHADLALAFANQVAVALDNAQLFEQSIQRAMELNERTQRLVLLNRVSGELNTTLDIQRIVDIAVREMSSALDMARVAAVLHDEPAQKGRLLAEYPPGSTPLTPLSFSLTEDAITNRLNETKAPIVIEDVALSDLISPSARLQMVNRGVRGMLVVPLAAGGALLGSMAVDHTEDQGNFSSGEIELAQTIANQTASAVQNARLFDETQLLFEESRQRGQELAALFDLGVSASQVLEQSKLIDITLENVQRLMQVNSVTLVRVNESHELIADSVEAGQRLKQTTIPRTGNTFSEHLVNSGKPLLIGDTQSDKLPVSGYKRGDPARAWLGVPLLIRGITIGGILVQSNTPHAFKESHLRLLSQVANQVAVTFENARLFAAAQTYAAGLEQRVAERTAALERERDRVETLLRITSELSASLDLDRVLTRALSLVSDVIGGVSGGLFLIDSQSDSLIHRAALGPNAHLPPGGQPAHFKRGEGLVGWVIKHQQPIIAPDLSQDERWVAREADKQYRSALCAPLLSSEDCLGAMVFFSDQLDAFSDDQLRLVAAAANQVTSAINNAELYRLIRDQAERLGGMLRANQVEATKSRAILESVADGVLVTDDHGRITLFNATAERILRLERDEVLARPVGDFMGLYGTRAKSLIDTIEKWNADPYSHHAGEYIAEQLHLEDKRIVSVILAPVITADEFLGTVSIFRDITREVEVDRLKTEFITTVSHELRTPITPIKGYADILLMGMAGPLSPDQQRAIELIKNNADRLKVLVDDLLDISKIESGTVELQLESVPVNEIVDAVQGHLQGRIAAQDKSMSLTVDVPPDTPPIFADRQRLIQILTALADNAFTYTHGGGTITVGARRDGDSMLISVKDTGIGIAPEELRRVFERFYRGEDPLVMGSAGTGLGLSIVQRLVDMHGGRIWVESEGHGRGSTFYVRLRLASAAEPAAAATN